MTSRSREMRGDLRKEGAGEEEDAAGGGGGREGEEARRPRPFGLKTWGPPPRPWRALAKLPGARCTPLKQQGGDLFDRRY